MKSVCGPAWGLSSATSSSILFLGQDDLDGDRTTLGAADLGTLLPLADFLHVSDLGGHGSSRRAYGIAFFVSGWFSRVDIEFGPHFLGSFGPAGEPGMLDLR